MDSRFKIKLDKKSPYPAYLQLANVLREKIKSGELRENDPFPQERVFSKSLQISRPTLRKALNILNGEGYIYKIWATGIFVAEKKDKISHNPVELNTRAVGISSAESFERSHSAVMANSAVSFLHSRNAQVIKMNYLDSADEKEHILRNRQLLSGLIMYPPNQPDVEFNINYVQTLGLPCVLMGNTLRFSGMNIDCVDSADGDGAIEAVRYFINNGHKKIAFMLCNQDISLNTRRRTGYKQAVKEAGLRDNFIVQVQKKTPNSNLITCVYETALKVFKEKNRPTAILAENDATALGIYNAFNELKIKVPEDVELIGCGNDIEVLFFFPSREFPISTVAIPREAIGRKAAELLLDRINKPHLPPRDVLLPTKLIHRKTTMIRTTGKDGRKKAVIIRENTEPVLAAKSF